MGGGIRKWYLEERRKKFSSKRKKFRKINPDSIVKGITKAYS